MEQLIAWFLEWLRWLQLAFPATDLLYLGALIPIILALAPYYKKVMIFMYKSYIEPIGKFFSTFATLPDRLSSLETKVNDGSSLGPRVLELEKIQNDIRKELSPNGGTSVKDVVNNIAKSVDRMNTATQLLVEQASRMESRQQSILNTIDVPTFETDSRGHYIFANKALLDLVGRNIDDLIGFGWMNIIHPEDRSAVKHEWDAAVADNRNFELEYRVVCRERDIFKVYCYAAPIAGDKNGYSGYYDTIEKIGKYDPYAN